MLHDDLPDEVAVDAVRRRCYVRRHSLAKKHMPPENHGGMIKAKKLVPPLLGAPPQLPKVDG
jgi:hypothetical protein